MLEGKKGKEQSIVLTNQKRSQECQSPILIGNVFDFSLQSC